MNRPPGLPSRDARTPESIKNAKFLVEGLEGMVDTPTEEQLKAVEESIKRKLQARRSVEEITQELCDVQPMHSDKKVVDAFNTLWDITVNQKKTIIITTKKEQND